MSGALYRYIAGTKLLVLLSRGSNLFCLCWLKLAFACSQGSMRKLSNKLRTVHSPGRQLKYLKYNLSAVSRALHSWQCTIGCFVHLPDSPAKPPKKCCSTLTDTPCARSFDLVFTMPLCFYAVIHCAYVTAVDVHATSVKTLQTFRLSTVVNTTCR